MALLHLAKAWADGAGRPLVAFTVDHGLQPASEAWSRFAAERAGRLGVPHRTLRWIGEKPSRGLPAAARAARHALLADAARQAGARVVLMAHTADDLMEAALMRAAGASVGAPLAWSPSPAWPQGRGVFLLRPLLTRRRGQLRGFLKGLGETWIEDPANDDPRFSRALARRRLAQGACAKAQAAESPAAVSLDAVREGEGGELLVQREVLASLSPSDERRLIGALALCAAGGTRPPPPESLDRVRAGLAGRGFVATLAGARIETHDEDVMFCREAGERARRGLGAEPLAPGESVFDGRFLIAAGTAAGRIACLRGLAPRLPPDQRRRLARHRPAVRASLPAVISPRGDVSCPTLAGDGPVGATALAGARLRAAMGAVRDEAALQAGAPGR